VLSNWLLRLSEYADGTLGQVAPDAEAALLEHRALVEAGR
jgi:hypothetical protein